MIINIFKKRAKIMRNICSDLNYKIDTNFTNEKINIPITAEITIRDFLFSHNSGPVQIIKPVYPMPCKIVYRVYFDDGHTHGNTACELKTFV